MSTAGPEPEPAAPEVAPEHPPAAPAERSGPASAPPAAVGAALAADDPRLGLDPAAVLALQSTAGNRVVARTIGGRPLQRQGQPAAPAQQGAPPAAAPGSGGLTSQQAVILSAAILDVSNTFNQVYLAQKKGLDDLRRDLEKKNEPGLAESVIWALVDAALGQGVKKVSEVILTKVGTIAVDRLSGPVTQAINQAGSTLSPDTHQAVFTIAIEQAGKRHATAITAAAGSWAAGKVSAGSAAVRGKIASDQDEVQQFLSAQELTLIEHLADRQGELTGTMAPVLSAAPFPEAMTAAVAMREAAGEARREADILQYLASSAAWGEALAGGGGGRTAALSEGARGVLFVKIPEDPAAAFQILSAKIEGMPDEMRKRLRSTPAFQQRPIRDWPLATVIQNSRLYLAIQANSAVDDNAVRFGHEWLVARGKALYNMTGGPAKVAGALLQSELAQKTLASLGELGG